MAPGGSQILTTYRSTIEFTADGTVIKRIAGEERLPLLPSRHDSFLNEMRIGQLVAEVGSPVRAPRLLLADEASRTLVFERAEGAPLGPKHPDRLATSDLDVAVGIASDVAAFRPRREWMYRLPVAAQIDHHHHLGAITAAEATLARHALRRGEAGFAHGDFSARNLLVDADGAFVVLDWERAGIYPPGFDLAFLWYTTGGVQRARRRIEVALGDSDRPGFWLSALLIALLHHDTATEAGPGIARQPDETLETIVAHLADSTVEGSHRA